MAKALLKTIHFLLFQFLYLHFLHFYIYYNIEERSKKSLDSNLYRTLLYRIGAGAFSNALYYNKFIDLGDSQHAQEENNHSGYC